MQIDFHHAVTYVVARLAGFEHPQANTIAYCAQYVDDATNGGAIRFDNGAMYKRISSAHKTVDYRNFGDLANHFVWIPFHFLPGNGGKPGGENPEGSFIQKLVCMPNSAVAMDMVRACIAGRDAPYGLHRLGVTMHVYADSWAHQGFAGVNHKINEVHDVRDEHDRPDTDFLARVKGFFGEMFDQIGNRFITDTFPLGHGAALSYPDRPYLRWQYYDGLGKLVRRDNPRDFLEAADCMCKAMQRFRLGNADAQVRGLAIEDKSKLDKLFRTFTDEEARVRYQRWLEAISQGYFSFSGVSLDYASKGPGSWKYAALGTVNDVELPTDLYPYDGSFLSSHWKMFHDAVQAHRFELLHEILPRYGICVA